MAEHYYTKTPQTQSRPQEWAFTLKNQLFHFKTDTGVFSKREIDFGSQLLIEHFEANARMAGPLLDVGCGYGPIGLVLAKTEPNRVVHMVDVNERAIALANENAIRNQITNVEIYQSNLYQQVKETQFAAILSNPPIRAGKVVVHEILEKAWQHLAEGGELWIVIRKQQGASSAETKMAQVFGNVEVVVKKKGYFILKSKKAITG